MRQTVYVDVLVSVNLLVDYFLLYAAAVISGRRRDRVRMCLGAVIGAAGSLTILLPRLPPVCGLLITGAIAAMMTAAAFGVSGWRSFLYTLVVMYTLSAGYSGVMLLLWRLTGGNRITVNNGAVYINIDPTMIVLTTVVFYAVISFFSGRIRAKGLSRRRCRVMITQDGRSVTFDGLIDTGNVLTEPFSGLPVIVVRRNVIETIFPDGAAQTTSPETAIRSCVRLIPYHTAAGSGLMTACRPDRIDIEIDGKISENVSAYVALTDNDSGMAEESIVNPDALEL